MEIQGYTATMYSLYGTGTDSGFGGFTLSGGVSASASEEISTTFGQEILRRVEAGNMDETGAQGAAEGSGEGLARAMASSVDYVRSNYGDETAQRFMATMLRYVGQDGIDEDTFGKAMLNAVKLIDSKFGFAEGDKLISHLNQGLNKAVNEYFDNGLSEQIYAVSSSGHTSGNGLSLAMEAAVAGVAEAHGDDDAKSVMDMLLASLEQSDSLAQGLRDGLKDAQAYLEGKYGPDAAQALLASSMPGAATAAKGMLLNASV